MVPAKMPKAAAVLRTVSQIKHPSMIGIEWCSGHGAVDNDFREPIQDDNDHHPAEDDLGLTVNRRLRISAARRNERRLFSEHLKPIQKCSETLIKSPATITLRNCIVKGWPPLSRWSCGNLRQAVHLPIQPPMFLQIYKNYDPRRHSAALGDSVAKYKMIRSSISRPDFFRSSWTWRTTSRAIPSRASSSLILTSSNSWVP